MTWRLGVVGSPIAHSLSPTLHRAGLESLGLDGTSEAFDVKTSREVRQLFDQGVDALSVTAPLKESVRDICDEIDEWANEAESVNSIVRRGDLLVGKSTDGAGFLDSLREEGHLTVSGLHVVVLGAGGAARAIISALVTAGVSSVVVHGRSAHNVDRLVTRYGVVSASAHVYRPIDVVVNTIPPSSRSTYGSALQGVGPHTTAIDLAYSPVLTPWMIQQRNVGAQVFNGLAMLVHQAAHQLSWWFGVSVQTTVLFEALA